MIGYKNVAIRQYFDHLEDKWCPLKTHGVKELKAHALLGWKRLEEDEDLGEFAKRLKNDLSCPAEDGIKVSNDDMLLQEIDN